MEHDDEQKQQLLSILVARALNALAQGQSRTQVIAQLEQEGADPGVAAAIASMAENMHVASVQSEVEAAPTAEAGWSFRRLIKQVIG